MKKLSSLIDYFYEEIYPDLILLEKKREAIYKRLKTVLFILILLSFTTLFLTRKFAFTSFEILSFYIIVPASVFLFVYRMETKDFTVLFKDEVIGKLVGFIDKSLKYERSGYISSSEYFLSSLFDRSIDDYSGSDLVKGKIDGVILQFSEIHTQKEYEEKNRKRKVTVFRGLFFVGDFNKNFSGKTVVLPDNIENIFGSFAHFIQSLTAGEKMELVKMDNPLFEKEFVVYSTDQIEARYILSNSLMEKILLYKRKLKRPVSISFVNSKIYIAVSFDAPVFEPKIYKRVTDIKEIKGYFEILSFMVDIVRELDLNRRVWTKY